MYDDDHLATPTGEEDFWEKVRWNFALARHVLEDYRVETREDALERDGRSLPMSVIAYREITDEFDQREYFLELGRETLPKVRELLERREFTITFAHEWGKLQCAHGYLAACIFDNSDSMANSRAALKSAATRALPAQKKWVAAIVLQALSRGQKRESIDYELVKGIEAIVKGSQTSAEFPAAWYRKIAERGTLHSAFSGKRFPKRMMEIHLADDVPIPAVPELFP